MKSPKFKVGDVLMFKYSASSDRESRYTVIEVTEKQYKLKRHTVIFWNDVHTTHRELRTLSKLEKALK